VTSSAPAAQRYSPLRADGRAVPRRRLQRQYHHRQHRQRRRIRAFLQSGETDIANASRAIKDKELDNCKAIDREPVEFRVGTDGVAVVVSKDNTFLTDVTGDELAMIFSTATSGRT